MRKPIRIRQYEPGDIDSLYEAVMESKAELSPWMPWCNAEYSRHDAVTWVESRPAAWESNEAWGFVVIDDQNRLVGTCGIQRIDLLNKTAELGYWIRSSATGCGIATQATRRLTQWAFDERGMHRLEILASIENVASQRVAEKAGFVREGILRERIQLQGRWHDCVLSALLNPEH